MFPQTSIVQRSRNLQKEGRNLTASKSHFPVTKGLGEDSKSRGRNWVVREEGFVGSSLKVNLNTALPKVARDGDKGRTRAIISPTVPMGDNGPRVVLVVASRRQNSALNYVKGGTIVSPGVSQLTRRNSLFIDKCSSTPDDAPKQTNLLAKVSP